MNTAVTTPIPALMTPSQAAAVAIADYHAYLRRGFGNLDRFTSFELKPCCIVGVDEVGRERVEVCSSGDAEFFGIYGCRRDGTAEWLRDFDSLVDAQDHLDALNAGLAAS
jgi:hypothetical protein